MNKMTYIIISISLFATTFCCAQNECEKLRDKEISLSYISDHKEEFLADINTLMECYYDTIDIQLFKGPTGNSFEQLVDVIKLAELTDAPKEYGTYKIFLDQLNEIKETKEYLVARKGVIAINEISVKNADLSNWKTDSVLLKKITYTDYDIKIIKEIVAKNTDENRTYYDVLQELATVKQESEIAYQETNLSNCETPSYSDYFHIPHSLKGYFEYFEGIECAKKSNKPIFLYFTGHGSIESREFESSILSDREILQILKQEYVIINLYSDDRSLAKSEHFVYFEQINDSLRQIGKISQYYQEKMFNENTQPAVYIINSSGDRINKPYNFEISSVIELKRYLIEGIRNFNK